MRPAWINVALAVAFTCEAEVEVLSGAAPVASRPAAGVAYLAMGAAFLWRRRLPWLPGAVVGVTGALVTALTGSFEGLGMLVALLMASYTLTRWQPSRTSGAAGAAIFLCGNALRDALDPVLHSPFDYAFSWIVLLVGGSLGLAVRRSAARADVAEQRATAAELAHELRAREAVQAERERIARELHDSVAHHVSAIVLHAEVLQRQLGPADARSELAGRIAGSGRSALAETRQLLGLLREQPDALVEPLGLDGIDELVDASRGEHLAVELVERGLPRPVPSVVGTSVYRVVQEALTNVRRHAGADHVEVVLDWHEDALTVVVSDDGSGAAPKRAAGFGLLGMAERARLVGGSLSTGARPDGGFRVRADFPLGQS